MHGVLCFSFVWRGSSCKGGGGWCFSFGFWLSSLVGLQISSSRGVFLMLCSGFEGSEASVCCGTSEVVALDGCSKPP